MSLATDSIFITALQTDSELMEELGYVEPTLTSEGQPPRLYDTAVPVPDEDLDNVPLPYIVVSFDGMNNDQGSKDESYESDYDKVNIGVQVVAKTPEQLHELTQMARSSILDYFRNNDTAVVDYEISADPILFESAVPCHYQTLRYACLVLNTTDEDDEQE